MTTVQPMTPTRDAVGDVLSRLERVTGKGSFESSGDFGWITGQPYLLDAIYRKDSLARRIVDCVADDMGRDGIDLSVPGNETAVNAFAKAEKEIGLWDGITTGARWGRLYGGGIIVMLIDGQDPATPLIASTVGRDQLRGFSDFDRWEIAPSDEKIAAFGPDFGLPLYYIIKDTDIRIHHSRVIRFEGSPLPHSERKREKGWTASVLEKVQDELGYVKDSNAGAANLLRIAYLRVFGINGYRKMIAEGGDLEDVLIKHFTAQARMQNILGATVQDKEDSFETMSYSFAGVRDIQEGFKEQISGASGILMIRLFGKSLGG